MSAEITKVMEGVAGILIQVGRFPGSILHSREVAPSHLIQWDSVATLTGVLPCPE